MIELEVLVVWEHWETVEPLCSGLPIPAVCLRYTCNNSPWKIQVQCRTVQCFSSLSAMTRKAISSHPTCLHTDCMCWFIIVTCTEEEWTFCCVLSSNMRVQSGYQMQQVVQRLKSTEYKVSQHYNGTVTEKVRIKIARAGLKQVGRSELSQSWWEDPFSNNSSCCWIWWHVLSSFWIFCKTGQVKRWNDHGEGGP